MGSYRVLDVETPSVVDVSPHELDLVFGPPSSSKAERIALKRKLLRGGSSVQDGDWDVPSTRRFTELEVYAAIEARIQRGTPWQDTEFYQRVLRDLRHQRKWGCANEGEFLVRCEQLDRLRHAIERDGYRSQAELHSDKPKDDVRICIRRDGRLLFIDGRHRVAMARVLGIDSIPTRIVARHAEWATFKQDVLDYAGAHRQRVYQTIDHPDLRHIPASHGSERIKMIEATLRPYVGKGLSLLDIGAHWGYMCQQLERRGFTCHAVEMNRQSAEFAARIAVATGSSFTVWRRSVFDCPNVEDFEVVLALNIFHHFLKTRELHAKLCELLERVAAEVMIFEAHRHNPPAQMAGAFRNYAPEEFAEFVRARAGFATAEHIGTAPEGRQLFMLKR